MPGELLAALPETLVYVYGRASDAIIFYGTNLLLSDINDFFLGLPTELRYGGFFTVRPRERDGVTVFRFTVHIDGAPDTALAARYQQALLEFLQRQSLEFKAKYDPLSRSMGEALIQVEAVRLDTARVNLKHRYLLEDDAHA